MRTLAKLLTIASALSFASPALAADAASSSQTAVNTSMNSTVYVGGPGAPGDGTTSTLRTAPQVGAPGFSSGHPCAYAPASFGVSVIGGGAGIGGQKIDNACLLAQMGQRQSAIYMIAARDVSACKALRATGAIDPRSTCGGKDAVVATSAPVAATSAAPRGAANQEPNARVSTKGGTCKLEGGKIIFQATSKSLRDAELDACKASLGY